MDMTWFDELEAKIPKGLSAPGSPRRPPDTCTWAISAPPCTPGSSPGKPGGQFIFRLEDTDQTRQVEGATELIYRTMAECD